MNILGKPFSPWVIDQSNVRQASLARGTNLTNNDLLYQNAKSPWLRLASTVDIEKDGKNYNKLLKNTSIGGSSLSGDTPARNFILQGGASQIVGTETNSGDIDSTFQGLNAGLNSKSGDMVVPRYSGAYGWGGLEDRGFAPMPGLTGANVEYYKSGALSKATVSMKCYTRNQLALMDVLYMRPGYNLLLEFGWSQYLDNDGNLQSYDNFFSPALSFILSPTPQLKSQNQSRHSLITPRPQGIQGLSTSVATPDQFFTPSLLKPGESRGSSSSISHFDVLNLIQDERIERSGNYEGVFGKINNFKWKFNPDGSYDCSVNLTGMGDMMESLKVNIKLPPTDSVEEKKEEDSDDELPPLIANKDKTTLNNVLWKLYDQYSSFGRTFKRSPATVVQGSAFTHKYQDIIIPSFPDVESIITSETGKISTTFSPENPLIIKQGLLAIQISETDNEENQNPQVYITFGSLLALIQKHLLIYNEGGCPLFSFDVDFKNIGKDENYIVNLPGRFSSNPLSCLVPYTGGEVHLDLGIPMPITSLNEALMQSSSRYFSDNNPYLSRLCNIYLNINNIANILDNTKKDEDGSLSLLTFLNALIGDFTKSLGGINDIECKIDEATQHIKFIENSPQRLSLTENDGVDDRKFAKFNTFGVKPGEGGSFVRSIDMDGSISSAFASQITIGAQSNGNKVSSNSTGLSLYNSGLIDRVVPEKNNAGDYSSPSTPEEKETKTILSVWKQISGGGEGDKIVRGPSSLFWSIYNYRKFNSEDIDALVELNLDYMSLVSGYYVNKQQLLSPSFLPFTLSLNIDGMSGMKLYEKFNADDRILPPSYGENNVDLIISTLNHTISSGDWTTQISTKTTPRQKLNKPVISPLNISDNPALIFSDPFEGPTPQADMLRRTLSTLGYNEKGDEISNAGDITNNMANAGMQVFAKIKLLYPNILIEVTGGNDLFHQHSNSTGRHNRGNALDFTITPSTNTNVQSVVKILQGFAVGSNKLFRYLNEYLSPTEQASGGHFHISYGLGTEGSSDLAKSQQLLTQGLITSFPLTPGFAPTL